MVATPDAADLSLVTSTDQSYSTDDGGEAPARVYSSGDTDEPSPAIARIHTAQDSLREGLDWKAQLLAAAGYTVVRAIHPGEPMTDTAVNNVAAAGEWAASLDGVNPNRIAVVGHSGGGRDALLQATRRPGPWAVAVALAPPTDYRVRYHEGRDLQGLQDRLGDLEKNPEPWDRQSPAQQTKKLSTTTLIVQGTADETVRVGQGRRFRDATREAGTRDYLRYVELAGVGHIHGEAAWRAVLAFLDEHLCET